MAAGEGTIIAGGGKTEELAVMMGASARPLRRIESYSELIEERPQSAAVRFECLRVVVAPSRIVSRIVDRCFPPEGDVCRCRCRCYPLSRCTETTIFGDDKSERRSTTEEEYQSLPGESQCDTTGGVRMQAKDDKELAVILDNVSGHFRPRRITAVMGPSGCGKTTLLGAVSSRLQAPAALVSGRVYLNGRLVGRGGGGLPLDVLGFVPQEDIMLRELTVRQILWFSLLLKGNPRRSRRQKVRFLNHLMLALDIFKVRHSIVGDAENRGISGGQRKRVNIGIELVAEPSILLLDEPTSGLDATASADLVSNLRSFATKGLTIAMVIHQPRAEILDMINDLIVLQENGRVVFQDEASKATAYFESVSCACPPRTSPADFMLDVTTAMGPALPSLWLKHTCERAMGTGAAAAAAQLCTGGASSRRGKASPSDLAPPLPRRDRPGVCTQLAVCAQRGLIQHAWRNPMTIFIDLSMLMVAGGMLGTVFSSQEEQDLLMRYLLASLGLGLIASQMALRVFGNERVQFWREASAGVSVTAYFYGKVLAFCVPMAVIPGFFLMLFYNMVNPRTTIIEYYVIFLLCTFTVVQMGFAVSTAFRPRISLIVSVVANVLAVLFAGANPNVQKMSNSTMGVAGMTVSYARWTVEMQFLRELQRYPSAAYRLNIVQNWLVTLGYLGADDGSGQHTHLNTQTFHQDWYNSEFNVCVLHLLGIGIACNLLAFLLLQHQAWKNVV